MPQETKMTALVIKAEPYGESDLIVSFLTGGHGVIRGLAKGALKSRKRFAGCFEPFTLLELAAVIKGDMLARVVSADIQRPHYGIREDLGRIQAGSAVLELALALEVPAPEREAAFSLAVSTVGMMERSKSPFELGAAFFVKYLSIAGFGIPASNCSSCGGPIKGTAYYKGGDGLLCAGCAKGTGRPLGPGLAAFIRCAESMEDERICRLRLAHGAMGEFHAFIKDYIHSVTGRRLRSLAVLGAASFT
jgi:DNA repair protein RecO (recombination protein O)